MAPQMNMPTPKPLTKEAVDGVIGQIARYNEYGNMIKRARGMRQIAEELAQIAAIAEQTVVNEADDWFDAHTLKNNMNSLKKCVADFSKFAEEGDMLEQRMTALYEDMGHILNRYFEINQQGEPVEPVATGLPQTQEDPRLPNAPKQVEVVADNPNDMVTDAPAAPEAGTNQVAGHSLSDKDVLTARAVQLIYKKLQKENPELAKRFRALPPKQMIKAVWKMVE